MVIISKISTPPPHHTYTSLSIQLPIPCHDKEQWRFQAPQEGTVTTTTTKSHLTDSATLSWQRTVKVSRILNTSPQKAYLLLCPDKEQWSSPAYQCNYLVMTKNSEEVSSWLAVFPAIWCQSLGPKVAVGLSTMVVEVAALAWYHQWWLVWWFLSIELGLLALLEFPKMSMHLVGGGDSRQVFRDTSLKQNKCIHVYN